MAIFDRFFQRPKGEVKASTSKPIFNRVGPGQAVATPRRYDKLASEGYQQNVIAYRAVNLVARAIGSIPLVLERKGDTIDEHPLLSLLARPNPKMEGANYLYNLVGYHLIAGNAYTLGIGPENAPPKELWLLRPDTMSVLEGNDGLPQGYEQQVGGRKQRYAAENVFHWKAFNPLSDWYGMAPIEAAALAIDGHNEGSRWNLALIQNGGTPSGVLYQEDAENPLTEAQYNTLKRAVESHHTGAANAGRPLLLEGGLKWQDMGMSPKDMDWTTGKNMNAREIAQAFGVPPQMLGIPDAQTYSNYSEARQSLWEDTVIPMANEIVGELNNWLVPQFGTKGLKLRLDLEEIPALEPKRQKKFERIQRADFMLINEKRLAFGMDTVEGGDVLYIDAGKLPLGEATDDEDSIDDGLDD